MSNQYSSLLSGPRYSKLAHFAVTRQSSSNILTMLNLSMMLHSFQMKVIYFSNLRAYEEQLSLLGREY